MVRTEANIDVSIKGIMGHCDAFCCVMDAVAADCDVWVDCCDFIVESE